MTRYRYRTAILVGRWRETEAEAENDAVLASQADIDPASGELVWRLPGEIESGVGTVRKK